MNPSHPENMGVPARWGVFSGRQTCLPAACLILVSVGGAVIPGGGALALPPSQSTQAKANAAAGLARLEQWRTAVAQHDPGVLDAATVRISGWSNAEVQGVLAQIRESIRLLARSPSHAVGSLEQHWLGLTDDEARHGDASRVLKRGALLHTDIALLAPGGAPMQQQMVAPRQLMVSDGRTVGQDTAEHWEFARQLLDLVSPQPSSDPMVRQWYISTTACMQNHLQWGSAKFQLQHAQQIFPSDAVILFLNGVLHETLAAPGAQNALPPPGYHFDIGSEKLELQLARQLLQQAEKADPSLAEAHLRLGRVTGLLGNHDEAITELKQAEAVMTDPQLSYYAALFLGQEHEMLGHLDVAREQFEHAALLYPGAQSPLLALSYLAHRQGDAPGALAALERAVTLRVNQDPWWGYNVAHVRNADALMDEMRKAFGGLPR